MIKYLVISLSDFDTSRSLTHIVLVLIEVISTQLHENDIIYSHQHLLFLLSVIHRDYWYAKWPISHTKYNERIICAL